MSDDTEIRPLLAEIRDIVLRHEEVNRKDADFRKRVLFALLIALAAAVAAMGYGLMLVHATIKEIKQRQEQQQPQKVAGLERIITRAFKSNPAWDLAGGKIQPRMKHGSNTDFTYAAANLISVPDANTKTRRCPRMAWQYHGRRRTRPRIT